MPKRATPLTEMQIRKAKPAEKPYRLADGKGLYLEVMPNGSRYWRMKYRFDGKEKRAVDFHRVLTHRGCGYFLGLIYVANPRLSRYSMGLR